MAKKKEQATSVGKAAATLGSLGGTKRKQVLTPSRRVAIASEGARARNRKHGNPKKKK